MTVGAAILLLAAGCGTTTSRHSGSGVSITRQEAPSQVTRSEVMETALRYARHRWRGTEANVRHGLDAAGIRVDTPDAGLRRHVPGAMSGYWVPGETSTGVPYQWGGFRTPEEFDRNIARGLAAGDIYTAQKRALLDDGKPLTDNRRVWRAGGQAHVTVGHDAIKSTGTARGTAARI